MTGRTRVAAHGALATIAAAAALSAVFDGYAWVVPVAGAVVAVVLAAELVRMSPLPSALAPLASAAVVTCYVTAMYAARPAYLDVIPSKGSFVLLGNLARHGFDDVRTLATPVPTHDGLVFLAVVGVAAVALVVDLFAVTMRHAALAGLPLLAVFALCTSVAKHGAGWVPFVVATTGYLWLLLADSRERLNRWGRPMGFDRDTRPRFDWSDTDVLPSPLSVMGRRIGLTAIGIAVVVPLLVPGLRGGVPHGNGNGFGGNGGGSSEAVTVNPIVTIRAQLSSEVTRTVLTVTTSDQNPGYLRMTALDQFDGQTFSPSTLQAPEEAQVSNGIAAPAVDGPHQHTQITVGDLAVHWLPLPTQTMAVHVDGDWRYDPGTNTVFSARSDTRGLVYDVDSVTPNPSRAALEQTHVVVDSSLEPYLRLPEISTAVADLTKRVTAGATTDFDKAIAIQDYLTSPLFHYDVNVVDTGSQHPLDDFLLSTHRGFCQQFATAMAVMARLAGIPSRVAVGFTRGQQQQDGRWTVTTHEAHAWPELYFTGFGWLPFEPTPRADGQAVPPDYTVAPLPHPTTGHHNAGNASGGKGHGSKPSVSKHDRLDQMLDANQGKGNAGREAGPTRHTARWVGLWVLAGLLAIALLAPSLARFVVRRRRWRSAVTPGERAAAAWAELRATALDARIGWVDGLTPRATARLIRTEAGGLSTAEGLALDRIVAAVQHAWYAPADASAPRAVLEDDVELVRDALFAESTLRERLVLRVWPRSSLRMAREAAGRIGDVLDGVDLLLARMRARLRPRATTA